ncbi:MAG: D-alanine--D-alanine ligase [Candidatus Omnitrophota bacterium]|nr:D-alanine--D-alanine ligase [Candidatus Omnitrophota bacterium]
MKPAYRLSRRSGLSKDLKIGVLCGGSSPERGISLRSGKAVAQALQRVGFYTKTLDPRDAKKFNSALTEIDLAFVALHGDGGEDGVMQRFLERKHIPYTGSGVAGCRDTYNKVDAKRRFRRKGIPTPESIVVHAGNWRSKLGRFPAPFFVKPIACGSSLGIYCVKDYRKSCRRLSRSVAKYGRILAERKITGREYTVGILGKQALPVIELRPKREFYDYRAKYTRGLCRYLVPAPIPMRFANKLQRLALAAHSALGLRDLSRVDIMADAEGRPYVLEVNAIPGFTELSLLPKAARSAGYSFESLCCELLSYANRRRLKPKTARGGNKNG